MNIRQKVVSFLIGVSLIIIGSCGLHAESKPPGPQGKRLQIELHAYVEKFTERMKLTPDKLQWSVLVLPIMEMESPAVTYGWALPPPPEPVQLWMAIFTFDQDWMLAFTPSQRRVIAAHEVGHMVEACTRIQQPDVRGMPPMDAVWAQYNYQVLNESCADIVSAQLTDPEGVLELLRDLLENYSTKNPVIAQRIRIIEEYKDKIKENPLP